MQLTADYSNAAPGSRWRGAADGSSRYFGQFVSTPRIAEMRASGWSTMM